MIRAAFVLVVFQKLFVKTGHSRLVLIATCWLTRDFTPNCLRNTLCHCVCNLLWNQSANIYSFGVVNRSRYTIGHLLCMRLFHCLAYFVALFTASLLANHPAHLIRAGFNTLFWNHLADLIRSHTLFRYHLADFV